jgi:hypothetical protein
MRIDELLIMVQKCQPTHPFGRKRRFTPLPRHLAEAARVEMLYALRYQLNRFEF